MNKLTLGNFLNYLIFEPDNYYITTYKIYTPNKDTEAFDVDVVEVNSDAFNDLLDDNRAIKRISITAAAVVIILE